MHGYVCMIRSCGLSHSVVLHLRAKHNKHFNLSATVCCIGSHFVLVRNGQYFQKSLMPGTTLIIAAVLQL